MLVFRNICASLNSKKILDDISFSLQPHKITAVIGRNGSGKSTLVSCVTGNVKYTGEILYDDKNTALIPPKERAQHIAVMPQILPHASLTVSELVSIGRTPYLDIGKHLSETDKAQIENALEITGMTPLSSQEVNTLSGGEMRKAYLAMVLAQNTRIIILDEPTAYMDMKNEAEFLTLLHTLKTKYKKTIMLIIHDLTKAVDIADNILILDNGKNIFFGNTDSCLESGIIENVFNVTKGTYEKDGNIKPLYYC